MSLRCCDCGEVRESEELLASHISNDHLLWIPYECVYCSANDCTTRKASEIELVTHIKERHPGKDIKTLFIHDERQKSLLQHKIGLSKKTGVQTLNFPSFNVSLPTPANRIKAEEVIDIDDDDDFQPIQALPATADHSVKTESVENGFLQNVNVTPTILQVQPLISQPNGKLPHQSKSVKSAKFALSGDCTVCGRYYASMRQHLRLKHLSSGVYKCSHCPYSTSDKVCVLKHISKKHEGQEPQLIERNKAEVLQEVKMLEKTIVKPARDNGK